MSLKLRPVINAAGTMTKYGGSRMFPKAVEAMAEASTLFLDIDTLLQESGSYIANLLNVEGALVTAGASAGIVISTAACIIGSDPYYRTKLPHYKPEMNEIVIQRCHRNPYDQAVITAGATFVEIGDAIRTHPFDLERAITPRTAAIFFVLQSEMLEASLTLDETIRIAHKYNKPVIVDAAAELPPKKNLWELHHKGADLVIFSGGKEIRGPQSSGLLIGHKALVDAARLNGCPHYGIGRPMKVTKEAIVGFTVALECYLEEDEEQRFSLWKGIQNYWLEELNNIEDLHAEPYVPTQPGIHPIIIPKVRIQVSSPKASVSQLCTWLSQQEQPILVEEKKDSIILNPQVVEPNEAEILVNRIKEFFYRSIS